MRAVLLRLEGSRLQDICDALNAEGVPTPGGGKYWWPSHVHRLRVSSIGLEMICLQPAEVSDLAQLRQPFVGRAGGDPHADPGQCDAVPSGS